MPDVMNTSLFKRPLREMLERIRIKSATMGAAEDFATKFEHDSHELPPI